MKIKLKKKETFWFLILLIFISVFVSINLISDGGNLGCLDLADCGGRASCGTAGQVDGCQIKCSDHGFIICPEKL